MRLVRSFVDAAAFRGAAVSIGNFDGVHRGHRAMLETLVAEARQRDVPALVMTFDPHPIALLAPEKAPPSLSTLARKAELIAETGVDCLLGYPTKPALLNLSAREFFTRIIRDHLEASGLVEGPNFRFGRGREGDVDLLRDLCEAEGMFLRVLEPVGDLLSPETPSLGGEDAVQLGGEMISSSRIRRAIAAGEVAEAATMLGHAYRLTGLVRRGDGRGRTLGFPTANLHEVATLCPPPGVYAGRVRIEGDESSQPYEAAAHFGGNPTFGIDEGRIEVHLLDYDGDLYDRRLHLDLVGRLRDARRFEGPEALREQLARDVAAARTLLAAGVRST